MKSDHFLSPTTGIYDRKWRRISLIGQPRQDSFVQSMIIAGSQEGFCLFRRFPVVQEQRPVPRQNINNELIFSTDVLRIHDLDAMIIKILPTFLLHCREQHVQ